MKIMKKKTSVIIILSFVLALTALAACAKEERAVLSAPTGLKVESGYLVWNAVYGADGYVVYYNGAEYKVAVNSFDIPDGAKGEVSFGVVATKGDERSDKTELKTVLKLQLAPPANVRQNGNKILWDAVDNALYYVVKINGGEFRADINEFTVPDGTKGSVQVLAAGDAAGTILSSDYSEPLIIETVLSAPDGIVYRNGKIVWDPVADADGYFVEVNDGGETTVTRTELSVKYLYCGEVTVTIRAFSNKQGYNPSAAASKTLYIEKFKLATPVGLMLVGDSITFDAVEGAAAYDIYIDGEFSESTNVGFFVLPASDVSYVQVKAVSENAEDSELSEKLLVNVKTISTEAELSDMKEGGCYKLAADIALTSDRVPAVFKGVLDGDGHSITNVTINSSKANVGFFSRLENATITDLTIKGVVTVNTSESKMAVGALAGECENSTVENCTIEFTVNASTSNGVGTCGGVIGTLVDSSLQGVKFRGTVVSENAITGGLIGKAYDPTGTNLIRFCSATANVTANGGEQSSCGGFIGAMLDNTLEIFACASDCNVTGCCYVGGFVGYMGSGKISNAVSKGSVTATSTDLRHLGGFIGRLEGYNNRVEYCIAMAKVTVDETTGENILVAGFVGRTVGGTYNAAIYENDFYDSDVNKLDRIGNATSGRGDGITAKSTADLKKAETFVEYDASIWNVVEGELPSITGI